MKLSKKQSGFTIVELLIVIVVIGILAAISIVAYSGIQSRARDTKRVSDLSIIQKALELYRVDNGGYPKCGASGVHRAGDSASVCGITTVTQLYAGNYLKAGIRDPLDTGSYQYQYATGFKPIPASGCGTYDMSDNYIIGARLESSQNPLYNCWSSTDLNYRGGSNN